MKLEFSQQYSEKYSNIKFHENTPSGSRVVPYGRTDRHDETNGRFFAILRTHLKIGQQLYLDQQIKNRIS